MDAERCVSVFCAIIFCCLAISNVGSMPHSHAHLDDIDLSELNQTLPNGKNVSTKFEAMVNYYYRVYKPRKSRQFGGGELPPPPILPKMPPLPNFSLPHEEFKAQLEVYMEKFNEGLKMVMDGFHDVVHEGLAGLLGDLNHEDNFITQADPNMFKERIAKYDEEQAAKRRQLGKKVEDRKSKATPIKSNNSTVKSVEATTQKS